MAEKEANLAFLKGCILFNRLGEAQLEALLAELKPISFKRNQIICVKDSPGDALYIIRSGKVKVSVPNREGRELIMNIYAEGEVFGEMSVFDGLPRSADVIALTPVDVLQLSRVAFARLLESVPGLALNIISLLSRKLRYTSEQAEMLGLLGAYDRVAFKLMQLAQPGANNLLEVNLSQQDLAAMLGLSREWINKVLRLFVEKQAIELSRGKILIHRPEVLREWF